MVYDMLQRDWKKYVNTLNKMVYQKESYFKYLHTFFQSR